MMKVMTVSLSPDPSPARGRGDSRAAHDFHSKSALAAIPKMLPDDPAIRKEILQTIDRVVSAVGTPEGVRTERIAEVGQLIGQAEASTPLSTTRSHKQTRSTPND